MRSVFQDETTLKNCKIFRMLFSQEQQKIHLSFHTPGHKIRGMDITELSYSDNLSAPRGCIAEAERDIADILGAYQSFILTDGSTSGVLSILHAARTLGVKRLAVCAGSHKSVFNGCALLGITPLLYPQSTRDGIPFQPDFSSLQKAHSELFKEAQALLFTSPDYYGNVADLSAAQAYCQREGKLLIVDGAHGGHLHYDKKAHAGAYADMWVDGVHKSLPAFTQGAVVSASTEKTAAALAGAVDIFRTTSPSYPIMASVEYAVKYPRNEELEERAAAFAKHPRVYFGGDWTKICAKFGKSAFTVQKKLETEGIYAEFCDGNLLTFYLSPATKSEDFTLLTQRLLELFEEYPYTPQEDDTPSACKESVSGKETEWVVLSKALGRVCARDCGLFPPCTPLIQAGERIDEKRVSLLMRADNLFGISAGKILVLKNEKEE